MKPGNLCCLAMLPALAVAQESALTVGNAAWGGLIVRFDATIEPKGAGAGRLPGGVTPTSDGTHRIITDAAHKRKFGYDLHATLLSDGQTLRIALGPLSGDRPGHSFQIEPGW